MTPTGFSAGKTLAMTMPEYDTGAFGQVRQSMREGNRKGPNDPVLIVAATIASSDSEEAPLRLPLGVDTYDGLHVVYESRLSQLEDAREVAMSVADAKRLS